MSLSKLREMVKDREGWYAAVHGSQRVRYNWETEQQEEDAFLKKGFAPRSVLHWADFNFSPISPNCMNFNLIKNETASHYVPPSEMLQEEHSTTSDIYDL